MVKVIGIKNAKSNNKWNRCYGLFIAALVSAGLAIPFFVGFGVLFANGQSDWDKDGRGILLPGDLFMWFGLIFLDFAFIFGTFYYSTTLEAKPSAEDELPFVESVLGTVNEAFDKSTDSTEIKLNY